MIAWLHEACAVLPHRAGVCHFLETLAFRGSTARTAEEMDNFAVSHGITPSALFNRDVLMYKLDFLRGNVHEAMQLLAECVLQPNFSDELMDNARQIITFQRDEALAQPQVLVSEHLFMAAYGRDTALGRPEKCLDGRVHSMTPAILKRYMDRFVIAPRMVLSVVGVDHDIAVREAEAALASAPRGDASSHAIKRPVCPYIGGDVRSSPDWTVVPATAAAATAKTDYTHMMLAFPTVGWSDDDVVPVCVVDTLLGGGSSFSAGGPGKGLYSRLYREVLNSHPWVEAANAFSTQLYDSGLVGVYGAAEPANAGALVSLLVGQLARLTTSPVDETSLARARNQLASSVMMNLETRGLLCEDIGRQFLSHSKRMDPAELLRRIRNVTQDDVIRVMRQALSHPPSFAAVGDLSSLQDYNNIRDFFATLAKEFSSPIFARATTTTARTAHK